MIEASIVMSLLLLLTFGVMEFGHYIFIQHTLKSAAAAGARVAVTPSATTAQVEAAISNAMSGAGLASTSYTPTIPAVETMTRGTAITVAVECNWGTVGVRPMALIDAGKTVHAQATMVKE